MTRKNWITVLVLTFGLVIGRPAEVMARAREPETLSIARQGYLFAGGKWGKYSTGKNQQVLSGQLYAEFQIPKKRLHRWPIVMIHGGGQSGTNFTGTPDGREGWAQYFLRLGHAVYVVDQPGRGRAAYETNAYGPAAPLNLENVQTLRRAGALQSLAAGASAYAMAGGGCARRSGLRPVLRLANALHPRLHAAAGIESGCY